MRPLQLTYNDCLLRPRYSEILPSETSLSSRFSKNLSLNIPLVSAAMDTVTESSTAIVMAQHGGIGVIHKNLSLREQQEEVRKVKKYESGVILNPVTVHPEERLWKVVDLTMRHKITGVPVIDRGGICVGILTSRDMRFQQDLDQKVEDVMTPKEKLVTAREGVPLEEAKALLHRHRIEKLLILDGEGKLKGLITIRDILKSIDFPLSNRDSLGRLRTAAAVGVGDREKERASLLVDAQVDVLVVDTAHGHSKRVLEMVAYLGKQFPSIDIVGGNVATAQACEDLIEAGAKAVKVGMGPGSICTTRVISGVGVPQLSAIWECHPVCKAAKIPLIADGGVTFSGDVVKALAAGADTVMLGSLLAGTDEAPGETVLYQGRAYKVYRGMGSLGAMAKESKDRYAQEETPFDKLIPEGVEGQVPYRGALSNNLDQIVGGVRSGMGYLGARNLKELCEQAEFIPVSTASFKEGHPHQILMTKDPPNYSTR